MKITINITKDEIKHLIDCNSYQDACENTILIMDKIKRKIRNEVKYDN